MYSDGLACADSIAGVAVSIMAGTAGAAGDCSGVISVEAVIRGSTVNTAFPATSSVAGA